MGSSERIVAVGLLSEKELALVGQALRRIYMVGEDDSFSDLLQKIDLADGAGAKEPNDSLGR